MSSKTVAGWRRARLGDFFRLKHGFPFKSEFFVLEGDELVLTPGNFEPKGGIKRREKDRYYVGEYPTEYRLDATELLIVMTDLTQQCRILGSPGFVPSEGTFLHNQRLGKVINLKRRLMHERFLYHLLSHPGVRGQLIGSATGTTVRHTSPDRIYAVDVAVPDLDTQYRIADILSAYDELIENNTRRIAILEEMARRLYEEWFIRFRFPGHEQVRMVDSLLGRMPEGWEVKSLGDLARDRRDGVNPGDVEPETPYVGLEHIPRRSITLMEWGEAGSVASLKLRFRRGHVLFGKIRPYFHKVAVAPLEGVASSDAIIIEAKRPEWWPVVLGCMASDAFVAHAVQTSNGTKMPRANWDVLVRYAVVVPPEPLLRQFGAAMASMVDLCRTLMLQNRNLRKQRDLLLPKLISGEIDVSEASTVREVAAA